MTQQSEALAKRSTKDGLDSLPPTIGETLGLNPKTKIPTPSSERSDKGDRMPQESAGSPVSFFKGSDEDRAKIAADTLRVAAESRMGDRCHGCRRRLKDDSSNTVCHECHARASRRAFWAQQSEEVDRMDAAALVGVGSGFCKDGQWPTMNDFGLVERLLAHPLPEGGIMAIGAPNAHKSHLLAARTIWFARQGWSVRFLNWSKFFREVRGTYSPKPTETEDQLIDRYAAYEYLALDDLGCGAARDNGRESESAVRLLYDLLNVRNDNNRLTDVSSNYTPDELKVRFDPQGRIARRLKSLCTEYPMLVKE